MNRHILICGALGGLGTATVQKLAKFDYLLTLVSKEKNNKVIFQNSPLTSNYISSDFNNFDLNFFKKRVNAKPQITDIIFCHGVKIDNDFTTLTLEQIDYCMKVNCYVPLILSQHFIKTWLHNNDNAEHTITYISSVAAKTGPVIEAAYHASKRAMESVTLSIAREYASSGIRANVISPGLMDTSMGKEVLKSRPDVLNRIPMKRLTSVDDVAETILYLLRTKSITGQNIHVNAGRYMTI